MRVAVLGSWHDKRKWPLRDTREAFQQASRQIGHELAARGHSLIVGSDGDHTADCHAALGALAYLRNSGKPVDSPRILVIRADTGESAQAHAFEATRREHPGVFVEHPVTAGSQAVVKLIQTQLADAVVLVGGAEHTEQAGVAAAVSGKPLGCIGSFGGAAAMLVKRFADAPSRWGYTDEQLPKLLQLRDPFSDLVLRAAFELAWIEGAPKLMLIHGRSEDWKTLQSHLKDIVGHIVVLREQDGETEPITVKFERFASTVDGAIALLTPDDVGGFAAEPTSAAPRARENVWVEVGWFWGRRGRSRLLLLRKGEVTIPSDLGNVDHEVYKSDPWECSEQIHKFVQRLRSASDVGQRQLS